MSVRSQPARRIRYARHATNRYAVIRLPARRPMSLRSQCSVRVRRVRCAKAKEAKMLRVRQRRPLRKDRRRRRRHRPPYVCCYECRSIQFHQPLRHVAHAVAFAAPPPRHLSRHAAYATCRRCCRPPIEENKKEKEKDIAFRYDAAGCKRDMPCQQRKRKRRSERCRSARNIVKAHDKHAAQQSAASASGHALQSHRAPQNRASEDAYYTAFDALLL